MQIHALAAPFGAEISGVDLSQPVPAALTSAIIGAMAEHSLLVFRDQALEPEDIVRFSRSLGTLRIPLNDQYSIPGYEGLHRVSNILEGDRHVGLPDAGVFWHSDGAYMERPDLCTLLYSVEVPRDDRGEPLGDTVFASTRLAYEALPMEMSAKVDGLKAEFSVQKQYERKRRMGVLKREVLSGGQRGNAPDRVHPVVRTHPVTGQKNLFVSDGHTTRILGVPEEDSEPLLQALQAHILDPRFGYRHRWSENEVVVWDNCSTQHLATFDYKLPQRRLMYRTSCIGSIPV
ncbi:MAG: TauD/TfdA family dioxygenase [Rhodocyclaceae bacterium]|nr:TauD/TfdA family dioxygenase [Rhodocyclaceae bacterium]MCA3074729.1 TauD/TfdA family dioxygenase [Rhodocyclaceae bacterium]MCA3091645.1 TauD/TfdA family dioxygenase [Rhodocyclaceae bacterium]MCA3093997.1 TauD/TfdA family dioxygenase [Rhodocyclaceae bacterium]MCA3099212.1 TauD/TfdA family dioxygenase [Rhodocyclaceae bacterium]